MPSDPNYDLARLAEFEAVPGQLFLGPGQEGLTVLVRAFRADSGEIRLVIENGDQTVQHQLMVNAARLQRLVEDPQKLE